MKRLRIAKVGAAEQRAAPGVGQVQRAHGAGDTDVEQAALLLEAALVDGARMREDAVLQPAMKTVGYSRPFAL